MFSQGILVASDMLNPKIDICGLHYFLSSLLHIHIKQTVIVKYKISWSLVVYDWVSFHSKV